MSFTFQNPFAYFNNPANSNPVGLGNLYVGLPDTDPVTPSNQVPVFAVQPDGSELAIPQPVRMTAGGVLTYNGTPIQLKAEADIYSVKVTSSAGAQLYYTPRVSQPFLEFKDSVFDPFVAALADPESDVIIAGLKASSVGQLGRAFATLSSFGGIPDEITDATDNLQDAIESGAIIIIDGKYKIAGTVNIVDGTHIIGLPDSELIGAITPQGGGAYPNQMINGQSKSGVIFENVNFNFSKGSYNYVVGAGLTTINSILFDDCESVVFDGCYFFDFVTNLNSSLTGVGLLDFGMSQIRNCKNVFFQNSKFENIREETINAYKCTSIHVKGSEFLGASVNTSSHGGYWYCDGVYILENTFEHTGGSVLNCCSSNAHIKDNIVNSGRAAGGFGIDVGNELDAEPFSPSLMIISGNYLNVIQYGVVCQPSTNNAIYDHMLINENDIIVTPTGGGIATGVRVLSPKSCFIENNRIAIGDVTQATSGRAFLVSLDSAVVSEIISISNNYARALTFIGFQHNLDGNVETMIVDGNKFKSQDVASLSVSSGASIFFFVRNNSSATGVFKINSLKCSRNEAENIGGAFAYTSLDKPSSFSFDDWSFSGNTIKGILTNSLFCMLIGAAGVVGARKASLSLNVFENCGRLLIDSLASFYGYDNRFSATNALANYRLGVFAHNGIFRWMRNESLNVNNAFNDVQQVSAGTYPVITISGNYSISTASALVFTTNMPANTVLPN